MLLFMDGMAHYGEPQLGFKYTNRNNTDCTWSIVSEGRFGGTCLKRVSTAPNSGGGSGYLDVAPLATRAGLWTPTLSGVCGFAVKIDNLNKISTSPIGLFMIVEQFFFHLRVIVEGNGTFSVYRILPLGFDEVIATSIEGLQSNTWAYVEFKWILHETDGLFEIRVNTIPVLTFTGKTMGPVSNTLRLWNAVRLFSLNSNSGAPMLTMRFADLYLADLGGGAGDVKDFLGDGVIQTIFPNGPGLAAGWTPSSGTANWDLVNDKPLPDYDGTYVETTPPGTRDCHEFEDIPAGANILGVHYNMLARKVDEGTMTVKPIAGQGGVMYDGPTQGVASTAYDRYLTQPYDVNPATGVAWTAAEINAGQWGILKQS